jgi:hypothetical protein
MKNDPVVQAARNNALWCDAVCRVNGGPGEFQASLWFNRHGTPRFYPDAVTLADAAAEADLVDVVTALVASDHRRGWAIKDSFNGLELSCLGFEVLFDAQWLFLESPAGKMGPDDLAIVASETELTAWERAWAGPETGSDARPFRPELLSDPDIVFASLLWDGVIVGGGILNRGAGVVGLSNVFGPADAVDQVWQGLTTLASDRFPGLPLVGYETGSDLAVACRNGFEAVGDLRIWHRQGRP